MKRLLSLLLLLTLTQGVLAKDADPAAVQWAVDYVKACQEQRVEEAAAMCPATVTGSSGAADSKEVAGRLATFLQGQTSEVIFSMYAAGGVHGTRFSTAKGDVTIMVIRQDGKWLVADVKF